ncbi:MAG TPA: PaaI family thioesterase [Gemmatimonadaceae bacterium]
MDRTRMVTWDDPAPGIAAALSLSGLEYMRAIARGDVPAPPLAHLLGFAVESVEEGIVTFVLDPEEYHYNPFGVVHGGVAATLFDSALGCAVQSMLPTASMAPTMQLDINYIRPITISTGRVRCSGQVVHLGKRSATAEGRLVDMNGKLYAHATGTFVIAELREPPGS